MKKLIPIYLLLTIIFYSCTNINFCYLTNEFNLYILPPKPGDTVVTPTYYLFSDTCKDRPSITNIKTSGPDGLYFKSVHYLGSHAFFYGGILKNGNDFGKCFVEITGDYSRCYGQYNNWRISGLMHIEKPTITFFPASKFIEPFGEDSCTVTVRPECKYTIYMSNPDSTLEITPNQFPITINRSHFKLNIKDLRGFKRTSLLIFKINSDCDGSAVTKILYITIR